MFVFGCMVVGFLVGFTVMVIVHEAMKPREKDVNQSYIDECIKVMVAYMEGADIEYCLLDGSNGLEWLDCPNPHWNFGVASYRVKNEKHIDKEV